MLEELSVSDRVRVISAVAIAASCLVASLLLNPAPVFGLFMVLGTILVISAVAVFIQLKYSQAEADEDEFKGWEV